MGRNSKMDKSILKQSEDPTGGWQWPTGTFKPLPKGLAKIVYNDRWTEMLNTSAKEAGIFCIFLHTSLYPMVI